VSHTTTDPRRLPGRAAAEFERLYRANFAAVTAYFARRTADPQTVADLVSDTFVAAITSFATFDPRRGTPRAWLFGIARHVFARHCEDFRRDSDIRSRLTGHRPLDADETADLVGRIDAERAGRSAVERLAALSAFDREAVELVDLAGLPIKEAAAVMGVRAGTVRGRLFRARTRLRELDENTGSECDE
jgi:RNA polymerase sigma-70 factor (ECF subfamily)